MARWKAHGRLPIRANWTLFASSHGWGAMSKYWSKLCCLKGGWVTLSANFRGKGGRPQMNFGVRKLESMGYHVALFAWSYSCCMTWGIFERYLYNSTICATVGQHSTNTVSGGSVCNSWASCCYNWPVCPTNNSRHSSCTSSSSICKNATATVINVLMLRVQTVEV